MPNIELQDYFWKRRELFGEELKKAIPMFENIIQYDVEEILKLNSLSDRVFEAEDDKACMARIAEFAAYRDRVKPREDAPSPVFLWENRNMPSETQYTDNNEFRYQHDPDYFPYMFEMLIPEESQPKGAVVVCAGGDHGGCVIYEGYQVCRELNSLGYQCFLLLNRVLNNPWNQKESGADVARAIRYIRKNHMKYRIGEHQVAFAGFSNGGLTGEACIQYYSGEQKVKDHFGNYQPDEYDEYNGSPDAFLCVYGPRMKGSSFDYEKVIYPPTFFAVGNEDERAIENLQSVFFELIAHNIPVEIHTFAGTPHGYAGRQILDSEVKYPNFQLWLNLADSFMQDVYNKNKDV